jgi:hypothetical protein
VIELSAPRRYAPRLGARLVVMAVVLLLGWLVVGLLDPTLVLPCDPRPPLREVFDVSASPTYSLSGAPAHSASDYADLHIDVTALDESKQLITLRVSGQRLCAPTCASEEIVLASLRSDEALRRGLPPLVTVPLPTHDGPVQVTVDLPVQQRLIQYPFDSTDLLLGVALQQTSVDGGIRPIPSTNAASHLQLTLQEGVSQRELSAPMTVDPSLVRSATLGHLSAAYGRRQVEVPTSAKRPNHSEVRQRNAGTGRMP